MYGTTDDLVEWREEALSLRKEVKNLKSQLTGKKGIKLAIKLLQNSNYVTYHKDDLEKIRGNIVNDLGILQDEMGRAIALQG